MNLSKEIFVSCVYSPINEFENKTIDKIREHFEKPNIKLTINNIDIEFGGSIYEFLKDSFPGKYVILIINEKYLRFPVCNYEIFTLQNKDFPYSNIFTVITPDVRYYKKIGSIDYQYYWSNTIYLLNKKRAFIKNLLYNEIVLNDLNLLKAIQRFYANLSIFSNMFFIENEANIEHQINDLFNKVEHQFKEDKDVQAKKFTPENLTPIPHYVSKKLIGRDYELLIVDKELTKNDVLVVQSGIPGIGKTTLLKAYVNHEKYYMKYKYVAWISITDDVVDDFIKAFKNNSHFSDLDFNKDPDYLFSDIIERLSNFDGINLLVIDNANNHKELYYLKDELYELGWNVLISSQLAPVGYEEFHLKYLDEKYCKQLFYKYYRKEKNDTILGFVLNLINNHTLLTELIAKVANYNRRISIIKLYEIIKKSKFNNLEISANKIYKKFINNENLEFEKQLYNYILGIFDIDNFTEIEKKYLSYFAVLPPVEISEEACRTLFGFNDINYHEAFEAINNLVRRGWLQNIQDKYFIHMLVQPVILERLKPKGQDLASIIDYFLLQFDFSSNYGIKNIKYLNFAEYIVNVIWDYDLKVANLAEHISNFYRQIEDYEKGLIYTFKMLNIYENIYGENHYEVARCYNEISIIYGILGDYEKDLEYGLKSLQVRENILKPYDKEFSESYNNLAITYRNCNDYYKAVEYHLKDLDICERNFDRNHVNIATAHYETSVTYYYLRDFLNAQKHISKALAIWEQVLPENSPDLKNAKEIYEMIQKKVQTA